LISRIFTTLALFFVYPPIVALYPFDDGNAFKSWRSSFIKTYVATFSTIVAINILSMILPFLRTITLFNSILLDTIMRSLFVLAGLMFVKKAIAMFSSMIGAENLEELGGKMAKEFGDSVVKGVKAVMAIAGVGMKAGDALKGSIGKEMKRVGKHAHGRRLNKEIRKKKWNGIGKKDKITEADRQAYETEKNNQQIDDKLAEANKGKKGLHSDYWWMAYHDLQESNPELFENKRGKRKHGKYKTKDANGVEIEKDYDEEYNRLMQEKQRSYAEADIKKEKADKGFKGKVANFFYQPEEQVNRRKKANKDKKPERKLKKWANDAKGAGQGFLDIAGVSLKLVGDLTGISGFGKKLDEAGVVDDFKTHVKTFGKDVLGITLDIKTKKDKESEEKEKTKKYRSEISEAATIMETTSSEIENLLKSFEGYKRRQQEKELETIREQNTKANKNQKPKDDKKPQ